MLGANVLSPGFWMSTKGSSIRNVPKWEEGACNVNTLHGFERDP